MLFAQWSYLTAKNRNLRGTGAGHDSLSDGPVMHSLPGKIRIRIPTLLFTSRPQAKLPSLYIPTFSLLWLLHISSPFGHALAVGTDLT
jgi:hypothetical protein